MTGKTADIILDKLDELHPAAECELDYSTPFELLVAVILSAQCTDKRVNAVTKKLFAEINTPRQFAAVAPEELEKRIYSCGFYRNKAKNIISCSKALVDKFGGEVPSSVEELCTLDGVGRKTANVVFSEAFGGAAIAVDTHVLRVSNRIGMADSDDPLKVEKQLNTLISPIRWSHAHHLLIFHGRYVCTAARPHCDDCNVTQYCKYYSDKLGGTI